MMHLHSPDLLNMTIGWICPLGFYFQSIKTFNIRTRCLCDVFSLSSIKDNKTNKQKTVLECNKMQHGHAFTDVTLVGVSETQTLFFLIILLFASYDLSVAFLSVAHNMFWICSSPLPNINFQISRAISLTLNESAREMCLNASETFLCVCCFSCMFAVS